MGLSKQSFALYIQILSSLFLERDIDSMAQQIIEIHMVDNPLSLLLK